MPRASRVKPTAAQLRILERWGRGGSTPFRLVFRAKIVLLASQGRSNRDIARRLRINPFTVARWRSRFLLLGLEGIAHETPRLGSPPPLPKELVETILNKTRYECPPGQSHWSTRSLARAVGVSHTTIRRIWKAYRIRPPRSRVARLGRRLKVRGASMDMLGVFVNPPCRAVAISFFDPQTGERRPPVSPASGGNGGPSAGHRPWLEDLAVSLNLLDAPGLRGSSRRLLDQEFLSFLRSVYERRRGGEQVHLWTAADSSEIPRSLDRFLHRHPEFSARFDSGGASLPRTVIRWIGDVSLKELTDASPASLPHLRTAVEQWAREDGGGSRPFAWTREDHG